jgi:hypothetical protein
MNRRQFLAGIAAALAVRQLPIQLVAKNPTPVRSVYGHYQDDPGSISPMFDALYQVDPLVRVSIDYKRMGILVWSDRDVELIEDIIWNYKPIGLYAKVNDQMVSFERKYKEMLS